jgi:DNA-directed RNA polymerase subunit beta'
LVGLKENVIIGKLIPAGSGLARYRQFDWDTMTEDGEVETESNPVPAVEESPAVSE